MDANAGNTGTTPAGQDPSMGASAAGTSTTGGKQFNIPKVVQEKFPELIELIKKTESMSDEERDYWFQILPIMTEEQVNRLKTILQEEANQLSKLDDQYQGELAKLNKKHVEEWNQFQKKQDREALQAKEASEEATEKAAEEALLQKLDEPPATDATPQV